MEQRPSTLLFAAIALMSAGLGMFGGSSGLLTVAPFLLLLLPLLFGFDPAAPAVERLIGMLAAPRPAGPPRPHLRFLIVHRTNPGLARRRACGSRGPPLSPVAL